ncbi:DUF3237 domain-containing protein [Sphingosinicella sp. LHD-64]|uniref:DUF3237 domain-containing protein n=1 Tax=Sphingosinicella sp. LHD-64 TaxID=3072139 RepID=UPI00280EE3BD|nr:DUF3237 domain-containing protein [Sphingosinicella sp. LHD-64]MDQ8757329.1 DUF3237 domain-containing protein [Sphingosinicella sp. LHD-64]
MTILPSRHLFTLSIDLHPTIELGATPAGERRVFPVSGGAFHGERIAGEVLPLGGADYLLARADGSAQQDVRLLLRAADGDLIAMTYRGVRTCTAEVAARLAAGDAVAPDEYYLRTAPFFETASLTYAWLNGIVSVGMGARRPGGVTYELFEVL